MMPGATRALDLRGAIEAVDAHGHRLQFDFAGDHVVLRIASVSAALAAARSARALRADGMRWLLGALPRHAPLDPGSVAAELRIGARAVGRAGHGARPNWLGRLLGVPWVELHPGALLAALFAPRD